MWSVPSEMAAYNHWVCWVRVQRRTGQGLLYTKRPLTPDRDAASVTDPSTWAPYPLVVQSAKEFGGGIGYVFSRDDPYCGVDLDKCRNPATGEVMPFAEEIIKTLDSYTEVSPSGTGLHVIVKATLRAGANRRGGLEVYDRARFFCVGTPVSGAQTVVNERQAEIDALVARWLPPATPVAPLPDMPAMDDAALRLKLITGQHASLIGSLYLGGDVGRYGSDWSRALYLLAAVICRYTADPDQVERLMRESAVFAAAESHRQKWHKSRGNTTWGKQLVARCMADARQESVYA